MFKKITMTALGLIALAGAAVLAPMPVEANDFCPASYNDPRFIKYDCARITSGTDVVNQIGIVSANPRRDLDLSLVGSTNASATINLYVGDTLFQTQAVAISTTPNRVTISAPLFFDGWAISPTTALSGVNHISATGIQYKK